MTGASRNTLKRMIREMAATGDPAQPARFYVFDIHGDIDIDGASTVMFSEQTEHGLSIASQPGRAFWWGEKARAGSCQP